MAKIARTVTDFEDGDLVKVIAGENGYVTFYFNKTNTTGYCYISADELALINQLVEGGDEHT